MIPGSAAAGVSVEEIINSGGGVFANLRPVTRSGVRGIHFSVVSLDTVPPGTEIEAFLRQKTIYMFTYTAYSKGKSHTTSTKTPRENEQELDKPNEFFESINFK